MSGETLLALILLIGILALFYINARTWQRDEPQTRTPDEPFAEAAPRPKRRRAEIYAWFAELCRQVAEAKNSEVTRK